MVIPPAQNGEATSGVCCPGRAPGSSGAQQYGRKLKRGNRVPRTRALKEEVEGNGLEESDED